MNLELAVGVILFHIVVTIFIILEGTYAEYLGHIYTYVHNIMQGTISNMTGNYRKSVGDGSLPLVQQYVDSKNSYSDLRKWLQNYVRLSIACTLVSTKNRRA